MPAPSFAVERQPIPSFLTSLGSILRFSPNQFQLVGGVPRPPTGIFIPGQGRPSDRITLPKVRPVGAEARSSPLNRPSTYIGPGTGVLRGARDLANRIITGARGTVSRVGNRIGSAITRVKVNGEIAKAGERILQTGTETLEEIIRKLPDVIFRRRLPPTFPEGPETGRVYSSTQESVPPIVIRRPAPPPVVVSEPEPNPIILFAPSGQREQDARSAQVSERVHTERVITQTGIPWWIWVLLALAVAYGLRRAR